MTHLRTERTRARTLFTAALPLPAAPGGAAATGTQPVAHRGGGPSGTPHGLAPCAGGTTGGRGGEVVTRLEPRDFHPHPPDRAADVPKPVTRDAGPQRYIGTVAHRTHH
ncbi:hypothetical protein [Streptomyces sp. NPDC005752]|uniref:hypothetical protein n=1 Tax=Streptomyces sp. NPDC005752 TaxID=3157065 RepID=UPI0033E0D9F2